MTSNDELWKTIGLIFGSAFETALPIFVGWIFFKNLVHFIAERNRKEQ